jgi:hypothetical protein
MNKEIRSFANDCVSHYASFNNYDGFYSLSVHDLPDFVQNEFAAMLMNDDNAVAVEATGPDNKHWESKMFPALTRYLKNSTDKDEAIEFNNVWRDCVTSYCESTMQEIIDDALQEYNGDTGHTVKDWNSYYGVSHLFGA